MQWNQPFARFGYQTTSTKTDPSPPQIIGEGDVTSVTFPDGSVQFYFVPCIRPDRWPFCQGNWKLRNDNVLPWTTNTEVWFVRSITDPQYTFNVSNPQGYLNCQLPNILGDITSRPYSISNCCINVPAYHQKFHYDACTSTTDIHYIYPNLRGDRQLQYCAVTQTDTPLENQSSYQNACYSSCHCNSNLKEIEKKRDTTHCACCQKPPVSSSVSYMSVDSVKSTSRHRLKNKKRDKKHKNHKKHQKNNFCECDLEIKATSDKFVTTYGDQASGVDRSGNDRITQTNRHTFKRSDSKTDTWVPFKRKVSSNSCIKIMSACEGCSGSCSCTSTTETNGE